MHATQRYRAPLIQAKIYEAKITDKISFRADNTGYHGLQHHLHRNYQNKPCYLVDNHHYVLPYRHNYKQKTSSPILLIHIDQHSDMRIPPLSYQQFIQDAPHKSIEAYTYQALSVGNFIIPAQQMGIVDEVIQVRTERSLDNFDNNFADTIARYNTIILDIDLDFRDPQMNFTHQAKTYQQVRKIIAGASIGLITVATSPYFIDQQLALNIAKKLFEE